MKVLARRTIKYCTLNKCFFDKNQNLSAAGWFNRQEVAILIQMFCVNLKTSDCLNALRHHIPHGDQLSSLAHEERTLRSSVSTPSAIELLMAGCCLHLPFLSLSSYQCLQCLPPPWSYISNRSLVVCGLVFSVGTACPWPPYKAVWQIRWILRAQSHGNPITKTHFLRIPSPKLILVV